MEVLSTLILLALIAIGITAIFALSFRTRGPWGSGWSFFFVIFLFVWASSIWVTPYGPVYSGIAWGPILFVGILVAFLLLAATPPHYRKWKKPSLEKNEANDLKKYPTSFSLAIDIFFWMVIGILLISILISYW